MLAVLLAGQTLASVDPAALAVAAPSIRRGLHLGAAPFELVVSASVFAFAVLLVTGARAGAGYGYRRLFLGGLAAYGAGALGVGLAGDAAELVAARLVQGIGLAAMVPQILSMIQLHVGPDDRARAMGSYSMVLALGVALGQVVGGLLVATDVWGLGWRLPFLVQAPVSAIVLVAAIRALPRGVPVQAPSQDPSVDVGGIALLSAGLSLLLVPLTLGPEGAWPAWTWPCLAAGLGVLTGFLPFERRVSARGRQPLLDPDVFQVPGVKAGMLVVLVSMAAYASLQLVVSLHVQSGLGAGSLRSGLTFACYALGFGVVNLNWPRLPAAAQRRVPAVGLGLLAVATLALAMEAAAGWSLVLMLPALAAAGCGHGAAYGPLVHQLASRLRPHQAAALSGLVPTVTQLAGVIGVVLMGGLYLHAAAGEGSSARGLALVAAALAAAALAALPAAVRAAQGRRTV